MSGITKSHILFKKTKIELIGLIEHERKVHYNADLQAKKTIELLSQKISDLQSTEPTPINPEGLNLQLEPPPLDLSQADNGDSSIIDNLKAEITALKKWGREVLFGISSYHELDLLVHKGLIEKVVSNDENVGDSYSIKYSFNTDLTNNTVTGSTITLEQNLHSVIEELKKELEECKSQIKYASAKKYYKLEEKHKKLEHQQVLWKERESKMYKDFEELRKSYTDFKLQLEELHSVKNSKGEFVLGQMYPPGIVGFREMITALDYYMNVDNNALVNQELKDLKTHIHDASKDFGFFNNNSMSHTIDTWRKRFVKNKEEFKEKEEEFEKVYALMNSFSNLLHDCRN